MLSPIAQLLAEVFPSIKNNPSQVRDCWVSKVLQRDPPSLKGLSGAIEIVDRHGQLSTLKRRLRDEHPIDRPHQDQYDERLLDCLTEACAFAWANLRHLRSPIFHQGRGAPDIYVPPGYWIEAKAIHRSQEAKDLTKRMLKGEVVSGTVRGPGPGLVRKFDSALADAKKKFQRQGNGQYIVFFNFTWLDDSSWGVSNDVFTQLSQWVEGRKVAEPNIDIVIIYVYNWEKPFCDPYASG